MTTTSTPWWRSAGAKVGTGLALAALALILTDLRALSLRAIQSVLGDWLSQSPLAAEIADIRQAIEESPKTRAEMAASIAEIRTRLEAAASHCDRLEQRIIQLEHRAAALERFSEGRRFTREDGDKLEAELRAEIARVAARLP